MNMCDGCTITSWSIAELDACLYYEQDNWEVALSGTNLANTRYYSPAFNELEYGIKVNPLQRVNLSFTYKFY